MKRDTICPGRVAALFGIISGVLIAIIAASLLLFRVLAPAMTTPAMTTPAFPDRSGDTTALAHHLEETVPALQHRYSVPGVAVLLVQDGEISWSQTFGYACRETRQPLTNTHLLMMHSISKSVTARGIVQLVRDGMVSLDASVREYLGPVPYGDVTIRQLLSNSSGLPLGPIGVHYPPGGAVPDTAVYLAELEKGSGSSGNSGSSAGAAVVPRHTPGSRFEYSNTGFSILELVVREVTGRSFADYMGDSVLQPMGMNESTYSWQPDLAGRVPDGHDLRGEPVAPYLYPSQAPGGLFATIHDLGRFLGASINDPMEELYQPQIPIKGIYSAVADSYGLGHFLETLPRGERAVFHGGQGLGWMTHFHALPDRGEGIVVITNSQRSWPLIATILRDWSVWTGAGPVGMSRILTAGRILRATVVVLTFAGAVLGVRGLWRMARVLRAGRVEGVGRVTDTVTTNTGRARAQYSVRLRSRAIRGAELLGAGAIALLLLWALRQDYLFIPSVFPTLARPLGMALTVLAAGLALDAGCGWYSSQLTPPLRYAPAPSRGRR